MHQDKVVRIYHCDAFVGDCRNESRCLLGICSAGGGSGSASLERKYIVEKILRTPTFDEFAATVPGALDWSPSDNVQSPLVIYSPDKKKQDSVAWIVKWYATQGVHIDASNVWFYGDRRENIMPFAAKGYNSRQVSCAFRDRSLYDGDMVGLCGATPQELDKRPGNWLCSETTTSLEPPVTPAPTLEPEPTTPSDSSTPTTTEASSTTTEAETPLPSTTSSTTPAGCEDTPGWTNGYRSCRYEETCDNDFFRVGCRKYDDRDGCSWTGWTCRGYELQGWCSGGRRLTGNFAFGPSIVQ